MASLFGSPISATKPKSQEDAKTAWQIFFRFMIEEKNETLFFYAYLDRVPDMLKKKSTSSYEKNSSVWEKCFRKSCMYAKARIKDNE